MAIKAFEVYGQIVLKSDGAKKKLESFGQTAQKVGKNLTKFVTLPILGIGAAMLKVANDQLQAEAGLQNAINATGREAEISVERLKEFAGALQETTTFGDEAQLSALALVQQLSNLNEEGLKKILPSMLDFSAAMGVDLQTAASLIGKTLGSTTNALSRYGIEIDATAPPTEKLAQLTEEMNEKFSGAAETAAKTGLGPLKQLKNSVGDLAEEFGTLLLPTLNKIIGGIKEGIKWFSDLDESTKKTIITIAGIAAAAGPVISAIGGISKALAFLAANPAVVALTAIAALGATIATIITIKDKERVQEYAEEIRVMAIAAGVAEESIASLAAELDKVATLGGLAVLTQLDKIPELISDITKEYGITRQEAIELLRANEDLSDEMKDFLELYEEQARTLDNINTLSQGQANDYQEMAEAAEEAKEQAKAREEAERAAADEIARQNRLLREQKLEERKSFYDVYIAQLKSANAQYSLGLTNESELLAQRIEIQKQYVQSLINSGLIREEDFNGHIQQLRDLEAEYAELKSRTGASEIFEEELQKRFDAMRAEREQELEFQEWVATEQDRLEQVAHEQSMQRIKETEEAYKRMASVITSAVSPVLEQMGQALIDGSIGWKEIGKVALQSISGVIRGLGEQAAVQAAIAYASGNIPQGALYTAASAAAFLASGLVTALAGSFQDGGVVPGDSYSGDRLLARVNSGERILTAQQNASFENMMRERQAVTYNTNNYYSNDREDINVYVGEEKVFKIVQDGLDRQKIIPGRRRATR